MSFRDPRRPCIFDRRRPLAGLLILAVAAMLAVSCASGGTSAAPSHPGAVSNLDSQLYDSLLTVQASLEEAKAQFGADPRAKDSLNRAIVAYNGAQDAYKTYHQLAAAGNTPPDASTLQAQIAALVADIALIQATYGKGGGGAAFLAPAASPGGNLPAHAFGGAL